MRWSALLLPLIVLGCQPQRNVTELGLKPVPGPRPLTHSGDFVTYVETPRAGTHRAVRYDLDRGRGEVLAERTGVRLHLRPLPARGLYFDHPLTETERRHTKPASIEPVYVDACTGAKVEPDPALGLGDGRTALIDIVEGRALIVRADPRSHGINTWGTLTLYRGGKPRELGRILAGSLASAVVEDWALSPSRDRVAWTGPDGSFVANLTAGEVREQAHEYVFGRLSDPLPTGRTFHWLPDGSGFLEQWLSDGKPCWELFAADGTSSVARDEGRIWRISPNSSYWAVQNQEARSSAYLKSGQSPYLVQPVPGHTSAPGATVVTREWVIHGQTVEFYTVQSSGESTHATMRITPTGFEVLPNLDLSRAARIWNVLAISRHVPDGWQVRLTDLETGRETVVLGGLAPGAEVRPAGGRHFIATVMRGETQVMTCDLYIGGVDGRPWELLAENVEAWPLLPPVPGEDR